MLASVGLIYSKVSRMSRSFPAISRLSLEIKEEVPNNTSLESARSASAPKTNGPLGSPSSRNRLENPLMIDFVWLLSGVVMRGLRATSSCSSRSEIELVSLNTTGSLFFRSFWVIMCFCAVTAKFVALQAAVGRIASHDDIAVYR